MKFQRHDRIEHRHRNGDHYMVILTPEDGVKIEETGEPAYLYQRFWEHEDPTLWVRSQVRVEAWFKLVVRSLAGGAGRLPRDV